MPKLKDASRSKNPRAKATPLPVQWTGPAHLKKQLPPPTRGFLPAEAVAEARAREREKEGVKVE